MRRTHSMPALVAGVILAAAALTATVLPAQAAIPDPDDDPTRVALSTLRPSVQQAARDRPAPMADGCHVRFTTTTPTHCTYGKRDGYRVVVVIGDSIAAQWWAALDAAARTGGWRLIWMTKSACPGQDVTVSSRGGAYRQCDSWRYRAFRKIRGFHRVDMVVVSGSARSTVLARGSLRPLSDPADRRVAWQRGTERTIEALAGHARRLVVLRDTPAFAVDVPGCLADRGGWTRNCSRARSSALVAGAWSAERAAAAGYSWVRATELTDRLCRSDRCWPVTSNRILRYRDRHHLTTTFARAMGPAMYSRLRWLMR